MSDQRNYSVNQEFNLGEFTKTIKEFIEFTFKLETQVFVNENTTLIQGRETSSFKKLTGMDSATTVKINLNKSLLTVEIGEGKWMDKAAGTAVGMFLFLPAIFTTVAGIFKQSQMPGKIFKSIENYIISSNIKYKSAINTIKCPVCGENVSYGTAFCSQCGANLLKNINN